MNKKCNWSNKRFELQCQPNQKPKNIILHLEKEEPIFQFIHLQQLLLSIVNRRRQAKDKNQI